MTTTSLNQQVKPLIAEIIGTLFLALTIGVTSIAVVAYPEYQALYLPLAVGAVLGLMVYLFGSVSGGHFNPSVTFSLFLIKKVTLKQAIINSIGQLIGAFAGFALAKLLLGGTLQSPSATTTSALLGEFIGAFLLVTAVTTVVLGKVNQAASGLVVGLALTLGITISLVVSGGLFNPALAIALGSYHISYLLMPLLGGGVAAGLITWIYQEKASN